MNIRIKTVLILTLLFVIMALFWGIVGRSFLETASVNNNNQDIIFKRSTNIILADDIKSTLKYYKNVFGFRLKTALPDSGDYEMAKLIHGDAELIIRKMSSLPEELKGSMKNEFKGSAMLYFDIKNLDDYYRSLKDKCEFVIDIYETDYGTKEFIVRDNNNYILIFAESIIN